MLGSLMRAIKASASAAPLSLGTLSTFAAAGKDKLNWRCQARRSAPTTRGCQLSRIAKMTNQHPEARVKWGRANLTIATSLNAYVAKGRENDLEINEGVAARAVEQASPG